MKIKQGGGNAGHNGLKDISAKLSTPNFWRLRLGTGHPRTLGMAQQVADFVLSAPSSEHEAAIEDCIGIASRRPVLLQKATSRVSPAVLPSTAIRPSRPRRPPNEAAREPLPARRALPIRRQGEDGPQAPPPARRRHRRRLLDRRLPRERRRTSHAAHALRNPGHGRGVLEGRDHIMAADGRDNTACFMKGARIAADLCRENGVRLALLKAKSPSWRLRPGLRRHLYGTLVAAAASPPNYFRMQAYAFSPRTTSILLASLKTQEDPAC